MEKKSWIEAGVLRTGAFLGAATVIITVIARFPWSKLNADAVMLILVLLNFLTLMTFCLFAIQIPELKFAGDKEKALKNYCDLMDDSEYSQRQRTNAEKNNERVNLLVKQLNNNIIYYALTLLVVYLVYILQQVGFIPKDNFYAKATADIFNFLSSVFLYLGFKVLYNKTLDDNNHSMIYFMDAIFLSFFYILVYAMLFDNPSSFVKNDLSLISGFFNGLAMSLLFGRFISMEHSFMAIFENSSVGSNIKNQKIFYYGAIFILPLYSLVQPLFGDFTLSEFGDKTVFANFVFVTCFIGKLFFLILFYTYAKQKFIHLYLHLIIIKHGATKKFISCFELPVKGNEEMDAKPVPAI